MNEQYRPLWNLGGYFLDVLQLARGMPINLHGYMKFLTLRGIGRRTGAKMLIETGTYLGVTTARCAGVFEKVLTIELDADLARRSKQYLSRFRNVELFQGDAVMLLSELIARPDMHDVVVFLDAHYSGGKTVQGDVPEPALLELEILARFVEKIEGIIIDDFRLFGEDRGFPRKSELIATVERFFPFPDFSLKVHADQLLIERYQSQNHSGL